MFEVFLILFLRCLYILELQPYGLIHFMETKILNFFVFGVFEMAAMPFPCYDILLIQGNLPRVIPLFTMNYFCFLIRYFNLLFSFIGNGLYMSPVSPVFLIVVTLSWSQRFLTLNNIGVLHHRYLS